MKNISTIILAITALLSYSCSTELLDREMQNQSADLKGLQGDYAYGDFCLSTELIAGQHYTAGSVTVTRSGDDLIITYTTTGDWTIDATHLSIGNCADDPIPTTGSGNPKIGHFEYSTEHEDGVTEVVYVIDASSLDNEYCFAAHAEVSGPTGSETAWASGEEFSGRSWAMFVQANLLDCQYDDE